MLSDIFHKLQKRRDVIAITAALAACAMLLSSGGMSSETETAALDSSLSAINFRYDFFVQQPRDTIYVLDTCYLEVRLDSQIVVQHCRSGVERRIPCSSGNIKIHKAIETPEGLYTVQAKCPMAYSRQFDSTKMYFWVGFNGNIGFHGLDGKGYYRYLGKRPSSHGCIRLRTEDAEWMFNTIPFGTPVLVHNGESARCLKLVDTLPQNAVNIQDSPFIKRALQKTLHSLFHGRYYIDPANRFYFAHTRLWWGGIAIGDVKNIPQKQVEPFSYSEQRGELQSLNIAN